MGSYEDTSWADLRKLTRERRRERLLTVSMSGTYDRVEIERACLRVHGVGYEFKPLIQMLDGVYRRRKTASATWRKLQWRAGNRRCYYCDDPVKQIPKKGAPGPKSITVDHKQPLARNGADDASNWAVCCWLCNNRKGQLTEAEFFAVLAGEAARAA